MDWEWVPMNSSFNPSAVPDAHRLKKMVRTQIIECIRFF